MKLTKKRLMKIIQEEINHPRFDEGVEQEPQQVEKSTTDVVTVLKYIEKINNRKEYGQLLAKILGHAKNIDGSALILKQFHPSLAKYAEAEPQAEE